MAAFQNYSNPYSFIAAPAYQQAGVPQPMPQMPQMPQPTPTPQRAGGIKWVQGVEGGKAQFVTPGSSDVFFDSEEQQFFIKTVDVSGMPAPLRVFRYEEVVAADQKAAPAQANFVTHDELDECMRRVESMVKGAAGDE